MRFPLQRLTAYLRQYLGFSRRETYGTLALLLVMIVALSTSWLIAIYDHHRLMTWSLKHAQTTLPDQ